MSARAAAKTAPPSDAEAPARVQAEIVRAERHLAEVEQTLTAIRTQAAEAQLEVERLNAQRAVLAKPQAVNRRGMLQITAAVVVASVTGSLIAWYVAVGIL